MARIKSTNFYQKSGKVANEVFSNLGNGVVGCRAQNSKQAPLNAEQKINASGFSALNAEVRYLNPVLRVTFPVTRTAPNGPIVSRASQETRGRANHHED